ncbi:FA5-like protein [Mya arenaria]|uniref:FA5-like protein n=1 Tax=Mya arenaria TaxID=6604 RepID=A0ABY7DZU1_MYAAR|nr:FA5-like protein [Mya arenaria]
MNVRLANLITQFGVHTSLETCVVHTSLETCVVHTSLETCLVHTSLETCVVHTSLETCVVHTSLETCVVHTSLETCVVHTSLETCIVHTSLETCVVHTSLETCISYLVTHQIRKYMKRDIRYKVTGKYWINANDVEDDGTFKSTVSGKGLTYNNFIGGQTILDPAKNCVSIDQKGLWTIDACKTENHFICQKKP